MEGKGDEMQVEYWSKVGTNQIEIGDNRGNNLLVLKAWNPKLISPQEPQKTKVRQDRNGWMLNKKEKANFSNEGGGVRGNCGREGWSNGHEYNATCLSTYEWPTRILST